ncbi:MAG: hypothetical protein BWZ02_00348 [Lentisphaerae bacterium ADurb.BinA184]|nr:MAG: hypothetical protein BWZ02_00348 [Lentisphaerae bacterium ADurb.BinA184]
MPAALILLVPAISAVQARMNRIRDEAKLTETDVLHNAPPMVAFTTVALGSFRGLVADYLWLYSRRMQDEGNYFEMVQLASWIVKLQPRFTGAHAFLAWNMAYNISVTFNDPADRWRWVQRGIELIRDEALDYNPGDPELFKELGWIYQHKLGQEMDDANRYYKFQLAREMLTVFGTYPPDWERWAASPPDEASLRHALGPAAAALDAGLAAKGLTLGELEKQFRSQPALPADLLDAPQQAEARATVDVWLRVRWLRDRWKLDAGAIRDLNARYGDLDWRLPEAHALYWATKGLEQAEDQTQLACERMVFQSLSNAFRGGRVVYLGNVGELEVSPNTSVVDAVNEQYLATQGKHEKNQSIRAGYENFLIDAVVTLYTFGQERKAAEYYGKLKEGFPGPKYRRALDEFALNELAGDIASATFDQAHGIVQGYLFQTLYALALGEDDRAEAYDRISRRCWDKYMDGLGSDRTRGRRGLPEFEQMKRTMLKRCLDAFPEPLKSRLRQAAQASGIDLANLPEETTVSPDAPPIDRAP